MAEYVICVEDALPRPLAAVRGAATTPAGPVATTAYFGEYSRMAPAYAALEAWCAANQRQPTATSWEIYGDWHEDPAQCRTDIYLLLRS